MKKKYSRYLHTCMYILSSMNFELIKINKGIKLK
ncbi:CLUMA_CG002234, isoform A [Clunio marinus]|uniref:CLUMA_CG002234, isoform A n=1 Tax=Clunio marinus TaxID=568069 RepID=A0A1J1HQG6_9DIPT|nr:CLUMA_CG002234, isoform A [Clunio marinus]